jgi:enterochelin esterase-like enzyme
MESLRLRSEIFHNTRTVRVWLPPGYYASNSARRYPVFYFTDGIATFHGRQLNRISDRLVKAGRMAPCIFVGIDNGGSTGQSKNPMLDRANEYVPYADKTFDPPLLSPQGKLFPAFLEREVRPMIESRYRTLSDPAHVGLAGASYGAAAVLFTVLERPGHYGWLLLESPSLYIGDRALLGRASSMTKWPQRIYVEVGTREGRGAAQCEMVADAQELAGTLERSGAQTCFVVVPGAQHSEDAWRARLPDALKFLLGNGVCPVGNRA